MRKFLAASAVLPALASPAAARGSGSSSNGVVFFLRDQRRSALRQTYGGLATPWTPATRSAQTRRDDRDTFIERLSDFLHDLIQLGAITARSPGCRSIQRSSLREGVADASSPICPAGFSCAPRCAKGASESFS